MRSLILVLGLAVLTLSMGWAGGAGLDPHDALSDPAKEARARALFKELRCVVCQSESLDDSEADLAAEMRSLIREQIAAGQTDAAIKSFLVNRYGEFVLLSPPLQPGTWVLWLGPFMILIVAGGLVAGYVLRPKRSPPEAPLTSEEKAELAKSSTTGHPGARNRLDRN